MRFYEFAAPVKNVLHVQPEAVKQQARVRKVVAQIAASERNQEPTELDKVLAMQRMAAMKKAANKNHVRQLRNQLAVAVKHAR